MDISNWDINRIMQLPDWCFGRKWLVGLHAELTGASSKFDLSEFNLPDIAVIWEVTFMVARVSSTSVRFTLALSDHQPVDDADFEKLEPVLKHVKSRMGFRYSLEANDLMAIRLSELKTPIESKNRRLACKFRRVIGQSTGGQAMVTVSYLPREIPEWLR
ncbi:MAG: hypothetical protein HWN68_14980 [Desulfobacterales bacterium]|nr:hypothetical protein [Desulfobacterales bacterium]